MDFISWKKNRVDNFKLYAVTSIEREEPELLEKVEAAYRGGADIVQLRSKHLSDQALFRLGLRIRQLAHKYKRLFFVNDRVDLALVVQADGVHLGQEDLPVYDVWKLCQKADRKLFIGKSTHNLEQALQAQKDGVDYIGVGPIFKTPTKPMRDAVGLGLLRSVAAEVKIPFVAIGGIDETNINEVLEAGAQRIAVVRAIFNAEDVYGTTKSIREQIEGSQHAGV